jgi:hypothetical protein
MQNMLVLVSQKQQAFARLPFFEFLRSPQVDPRDRLAFAPCFAPFVMGFAELNRHVWRVEPTDDPIQLMLNQHTYEDDSHWQWFLEDLQKLGFDLHLPLSQALEFLWSDATQVSRHMIYELYRHTCSASPLQKLITIEAVEATADVFLTATDAAISDLKAQTANKYRYFGEQHLKVDTNHTMHDAETSAWIEQLTLTPEQRADAIARIEIVFDLFTEFYDVLLKYAQTPSISVFSTVNRGRSLLPSLAS